MRAPRGRRVGSTHSGGWGRGKMSSFPRMARVFGAPRGRRVETVPDLPSNTTHTYKQLIEMTKPVWFTGAKNVLGQTLYGNTLRTLLDDGFDRLKMALHPIVVYHKESSKLAEKLFCCISDDLEHDTEFGFEMQRELVKILKKSADRN